MAEHRELINSAISRLIGATVASCTCLTKHPDPSLHDETCRYRVIEQVIVDLGSVITTQDESTYDLLRQIVAETKCKPGWVFTIRKGEGALRLVITVPGVDSWEEEVPRVTSHWFPVPPATYCRRAWQRWIFECCRGVENHELGEWFRIGESRPFLPLHGPGESPYVVVEYRDEVDARTTQDGSIRTEGPRP